jgi:hypothetical protein
MSTNYNFDLELLIDFARGIAENYPDIWTDGKLEFDKFAKTAVKRAMEVEAGDHFTLHIDVSIEPISPPVNSILMTDIEGAAAYVLYCPNLNDCRKRFSIIKELCHLYIDPHFERKTVTTEKQLLEAVEGLDLSAVYNIKPEQAALVLAIELSLPWTHREGIHSMKADGETNYDIAKKFMIPEYVIQKYSDSYRESSNFLNKRYKR